MTDDTMISYQAMNNQRKQRGPGIVCRMTGILSQIHQVGPDLGA